MQFWPRRTAYDPKRNSFFENGRDGELLNAGNCYLDDDPKMISNVA